MRETRLSGSVDGVTGNHDPYSDWGWWSPPARLFVLWLDVLVVAVPPANSGATPELLPASPPGEDEAAVRMPLERSWAHASIPVLAPRFKLTLFLFIHIMG